jgi:ribosomal protein S18
MRWNWLNVVTLLRKSRGWLLFGYDVPEKPSRTKVRVWRQLKALGALYPQMSFCILPDSDAVRSRLIEIESGISGYGLRLLLEAKPTKAHYLRTLIDLFKREAEEEYRELAEECDEFLDEIRNNLKTGNVTQTEVSELEEALEGLERWLKKIKGRDYFGAQSKSRRKVSVLLRRCRTALLKFSENAQPRHISRA